MRAPPPGVVKMLLDAGVPTEGTVKYDGTAYDFLAWALLAERPVELHRDLIEAGCGMDTAYDALGGMDYVRSAVTYDPDIVLYLLKHSRRFVAVVTEQRTPKAGYNMAQLALHAKHEAVVRQLHQLGVRVDEPPTEGHEPIRAVLR